jgi:hypothetical protein
MKVIRQQAKTEKLNPIHFFASPAEIEKLRNPDCSSDTE